MLKAIRGQYFLWNARTLLRGSRPLPEYHDKFSCMFLCIFDNSLKLKPSVFLQYWLLNCLITDHFISVINKLSKAEFFVVPKKVLQLATSIGAQCFHSAINIFCVTILKHCLHTLDQLIVYILYHVSMRKIQVLSSLKVVQF